MLCAAVLLRAAWAVPVTIQIESVERQGLLIQGVEARLNPDWRSGALHIQALRLAEQEWRDLSILCGTLSVAGNLLHCGDGRIRLPWLDLDWQLDFAYDLSSGQVEVKLHDGSAAVLEGQLLPQGEPWTANLKVAHIPVALFQAFLPAAWAETAQGEINGEIVYDATRAQPFVQGWLSLDQLSFTTVDGLTATDKVELRIELDAQQLDAVEWSLQMMAEWRQGEAYFHPLYLTAGPRLHVRGRVNAQGVDVAQAQLHWPGVERMTAQGRWSWANSLLERGELQIEGADLARLGGQLLIPMLMPAYAEQLKLDGVADARLSFGAQGVESVDAKLEAVVVDFDSGRLRLGPFDGVIPWRLHEPTRLALNIGGGQWERLQLDPFTLRVETNGYFASVAQTIVPVLDGQLVFNNLALERKEDGWHGRGELIVEPISMNLLSEALGWPTMSGILSASLPALVVTPGLLSFDGTFVVSLFEGYIHANGFQLIEPFGVAPHLKTHLEARNLNLFQLTETFSFGSIKGYIDADIRDLELVDWKAQRFNAHIRSSPGRFERRISQRAVENISSLGGPGASLAIQRGFLGFFESFGYRAIGMSCLLENGVCHMGGIAGQDQPDGGFVMIQGGGIPALNVIGYNRQVDWNDLLERLALVIASNAPPVIE